MMLLIILEKRMEMQVFVGTEWMFLVDIVAFFILDYIYFIYENSVTHLSISCLYHFFLL